MDVVRVALGRHQCWAQGGQQVELVLGARVERVGGQPPEDFETIVRRYATASPYVRRTPLSLARALMGLTRAMLTPAINLDAFARTHALPRLPGATLAVRSEAWLGTHGAASRPNAVAPGRSA